MNYSIRSIPNFDRQLKRLAKKFPSIKNDLSNASTSISQNPFQGDRLINNCFKIRLAIASKGKGKSGGARIIAFVFISGKTVYLLAIYDKSEKSSISNQEIINLQKQIF